MPHRDLVPAEHRDWSSGRDGLRDTIFLGAAVVAVALFGLGGWAAVAHIDGAIVAPGYISVESNRKSVQHLEGGIVRNILVRDGDMVHAGDTLIVLEDTAARAQYAQLETQICELLARFARLTAERKGAPAVVFPDELMHRVNDATVADLMKGQKAVFETRKVRLETEAALLMERKMQFRDEIASLEKQRGAVERQIALIGKELETARKLLAKKLTNSVRVNRLSRDLEEKRGEAAELTADIAAKTGQRKETELEILRLKRGFQEEVAVELRAVEAELNVLSERRVAAEDRLQRTRVTAPRNGVVLNLQVHNAGHVVAPGENIMEIVPANDELVVKARIQPQDIDRVVAEAPAELVLSAFNRRTTPRLRSRVSRVSPDQVDGEGSDMPHFIAVLHIPKEEAARLGDLQLMPGMPVEVFIRTGERPVLSFILKPLTDNLQRAFREE